MKEFVGFHGTRKDNRYSILRKGFRRSRGDRHWLGEGAYFFEEEFTSAQEDAQKWAVVDAWDKDSSRNQYDEYVVLKAKIRVNSEDEILDLTTPEGLEIFSSSREITWKRLAGKKFDSKTLDSAILSLISEHVDFKLVRARFYIQLCGETRRLRVRSNVPNTTVLCVVTPGDCIEIDEIETVCEGRVDHEKP